jgi:hypothetical protein
MSDEELVKALKLLAFVHNDGAITQAALRIEALTAKLAKAVEALREIASEASVTVHTHNRGGINYTRMYKDWRKLAVKRIDKARDTLAEIEGDKE